MIRLRIIIKQKILALHKSFLAKYPANPFASPIQQALSPHSPTVHIQPDGLSRRQAAFQGFYGFPFAIDERRGHTSHSRKHLRMIPPQQKRHQPPHGRSQRGGVLPLRSGAIGLIDERLELPDEKPPIPLPFGRKRIFFHPIHGIIYPHNNDRLDLALFNKPGGGFIHFPIHPGIGGLGIEQVLPIVHIQHRIASPGILLVARRKPHDNIPGQQPLPFHPTMKAHRAPNALLRGRCVGDLIPPPGNFQGNRVIPLHPQAVVVQRSPGGIGGFRLPASPGDLKFHRGMAPKSKFPAPASVGLTPQRHRRRIPVPQQAMVAGDIQRLPFGHFLRKHPNQNMAFAGNFHPAILSRLIYKSREKYRGKIFPPMYFSSRRK